MRGTFKMALVMLAAAGAFAAFPLLPAGAVASGPSLALSPAAGPPTTSVTAKGSGYPANDAVTVTFDGATVATATTSAAGAFSAKFAVPASAVPGAHTVAAFDAAGLGASASFTVETNWAMARFDVAGSGFNPFENVLSPASAGGLSDVVNVALAGSVRSEPVYAGGELFAGGTDGTVRALDGTGRQLWSFSTGGPVVGSPAYVAAPCHADRTRPGGRQVLKGSLIAVGSQDGFLYGLSAARGTKVWSFRGNAGFSDSALVPAVQKTPEVIAVSGKGTVYAVDACTGSLIWSKPAGQSGTPMTLAILPGVTVGGAKDTLGFVGFTGGGVTAFDAATGALVWRRAVGPVGAPPAAYGSGRSARVVIGAGASVVELNAGTGAQVWSRPTGGPVSGVGLDFTPALGAVSGRTLSLTSVIAADGAGDVYSLNPATGKINWGDTGLGPGQGPPAIANGVVYLTTAPGPAAPGTLIAVRADTGGDILVSDVLSPQPYPPGPPSIGDGKVFVGDFNASLSIFELPAGRGLPSQGNSLGRRCGGPCG